MSARTDPFRSVLLDTCAVIWLANGDRLLASAVTAIFDAGLANGIFVSAISAWEVGLLSRARPGGRAAVQFLPDPKSWFSRVMSLPGIKRAPLTPEIAIAASYLPGDLHADPGDRLIIATARQLGAPIVTRDSQIIGYAQSGNVAAIPC